MCLHAESTEVDVAEARLGVEINDIQYALALPVLCAYILITVHYQASVARLV